MAGFGGRMMYRSKNRLGRNVGALLLGLVLLGGCGGDGVEPNPPECPSAVPISGAVCDAELDKKACYWDDEQTKVRTWCSCDLPVWNCFI